MARIVFGVGYTLAFVVAAGVGVSAVALPIALIKYILS